MNTPNPHDHMDELLLAYLEEILTPEQRNSVERHLHECGECASEAESLAAFLETLRRRKDAFCPRPWEIYEWVRTGRPNDTSVGLHAITCARCAAEAETCVTHEPMPSEVWDRVNRLLPEPGQAAEPARGPRLWNRFREWFRVPYLAAATVAAVLVLVLLNPFSAVNESGLQLSTETWDHSLRPKVMRPKTAALVFADKLAQPPSKERIDSLYRAIEPDMAVSERHDLLTPAEVTRAVKAGRLDTSSVRKLTDDLRRNFEVTTAVLIFVGGSDGAHTALLQEIDTDTGKVLFAGEIGKASWNELEHKVRDALRDVLTR